MLSTNVRRNVSRLLNGAKQVANDAADFLQHLGLVPTEKPVFEPAYVPSKEQRRRRSKVSQQRYRF